VLIQETLYNYLQITTKNLRTKNVSIIEHFSIDDNVLYLTDPLYIQLLFFVFNNSADAYEFFGLMREMLLNEVSPSEGNVTISNHPHDPELYSTIKNFLEEVRFGKNSTKDYLPRM
jgi:hypothetical protein